MRGEREKEVGEGERKSYLDANLKFSLRIKDMMLTVPYPVSLALGEA